MIGAFVGVPQIGAKERTLPHKSANIIELFRFF